MRAVTFVILGLILLSVALMAEIGLGWQLFKRRQHLKAQRSMLESKLIAIQTKTECLKDAIRETRKLFSLHTKRLIDYEYLPESMLVDVFPNAQPDMMYLADLRKRECVVRIALSQLEGWASYRQIYKASGDYNERMRAAGLGELVLTEGFIRETLETFTFDPDHSGPVIATWREDREQQTENYYRCFEHFILTFVKGNGGLTRRFISLDEIMRAWKLAKDAQPQAKHPMNAAVNVKKAAAETTKGAAEADILPPNGQG